MAEHPAQGIEYTTPFTYVIPGLPFTFVRDFLRVFLEVKTVCTPSGLHTLLIFSLMPLMYGRNTLTYFRIHLSSSSASSQLLASGTQLPREPFGHSFFNMTGQIPIGISIQLCDGGSLQCQISPLDGGVSCSGGSSPCGWVSCTHT